MTSITQDSYLADYLSPWDVVVAIGDCPTTTQDEWNTCFISQYDPTSKSYDPYQVNDGYCASEPDVIAARARNSNHCCNDTASPLMCFEGFLTILKFLFFRFRLSAVSANFGTFSSNVNRIRLSFEKTILCLCQKTVE